MVEGFKALVAALSTIPKLLVLQTAEGIEDEVIQLPCAIVEFETGTEIESVDEASSRLYISPCYSIEMHIERTPNNRVMEKEDVMELFKKVLVQIAITFPKGVMIKDFYISPAVLGATETYVASVLFQVRKIKFNIQ